MRLIFTDFEMPKLTGPQMVQKIRELERSNNSFHSHEVKIPSHLKTVIVGLTGHDSPVVQKTGIDSGMDLVIKKPPTLKDIKELFKTYLFVE